MSWLLSLCPEILNNVILNVDPEDLARLSKTCRSLCLFIKDNQLLWKNLYLRNHDRISVESGQSEPNWQAELQRLVVLRKLLQCSDPDVKRAHLIEVANTVINLLRTTLITASRASINAEFLTSLFQPQINIDIFLCSSSLFERAGSAASTPAATAAERQLSAQLQVLFGRSVEPTARDARPVHTHARARVYDLRKYLPGNMWGPFMDDGSGTIDWEKVQRLMIVLGYNMRTVAERADGQPHPHHEQAFLGTTPNSYNPTWICPLHAAQMATQDPSDLAQQDPYGVTGTWQRIVCFLNYTDLFRFNFEPTPPDSQELEPMDTWEAIRVIRLKLRISRIEDAGPDEMPGTKVVHYSGTSRSLHTNWDPNGNSKIRGSVRTTKGGAIRWTSFSIYDGLERWRSEGVQIGGIRSARGIVGTWFDKDYGIHGPAGPTCFWKLSDCIQKAKAHDPSVDWD